MANQLIAQDVTFAGKAGEGVIVPSCPAGSDARKPITRFGAIWWRARSQLAQLSLGACRQH